MKISSNYHQQLPISATNKEEKNPTFEAHKTLPKFTKKAKLGAVTALFLLPTLGIINHCNNTNNIEVVDTPIDTTAVKNYLDKTPATTHIVKAGENPGSIAKQHNISTMRLLDANNMKSGDIINVGDTLKVPESYTVKNINNEADLANFTGFDKEFLDDFIQMEGKRTEVYKDINGNQTIGIGHFITPDEGNKFDNKTLSDKEIFTMLGQDIINKDLNLETIIDKKSYKSMPSHLRESVMDLAFNKGEGAISDNKKLRDALNNKDYVTAIANLNQDYSIVTKANGEKVRNYASGLSKRRLFDMYNACKIFKRGIPDKVLASAKQVYANGLVQMEKEVKEGKISAKAYENVKAEYKGLAYKWYNGKIGKKSEGLDIQKATNVKPVVPNVDTSKKVYINGEPTTYTVNSLYDDWKANAKAKLRYVARPMPEIDANGNIKALVKTLNPTGKGSLNGKTIIINPGHGGAMN